MDEGSGNIVYDQCNNHGRLRSVVWCKGKNGVAPEFDGAVSRIEIPHRPYLNVRDAITIEAWIYLESLQGGQSFVSKGRGSWGSGYTFYQENGKLILGLNTTDKPGENMKASGFELRTESVLTAKTWIFAAVTYDCHDRTVKFYMNRVYLE
ncbi:MAG: hypothetical protein PHV34_03795 [Verrucomicrobiae bacterium]|nr:hypothetical protein [Verrucomicrobiae bacterium]